jgi:coenzyme F420 biosynthesis associated uncharacterized protein
MDAARNVDWSMGSRAAVLIDWRTAAETARRVGGPGPGTSAIERARLREDLAEVVPHAESLIADFTGLRAEGYRSRPWVMSRGEWAGANLGGLQRLLEPLAQRLIPSGAKRSEMRRKGLGAQIGGLLGYVSRKVLGQYDVFLPADDDGLLYFVGPNIVDAERRFGLPPRDFRLWIAAHEVTHRVQFGATPWLKTYLSRNIGRYLDTVQVDSKELMNQLRRAVEEIRSGADWHGAQGILLLMNEEQRALFSKMQSMMSLLEGHASFVMNRVVANQVADVDTMRRALSQRRKTTGMEKGFQRAIGFETKIAQYDAGERFVRLAVDEAGMDGFNRVWEREEHLPTIEEIAQPERWVARVVRS